MGYHNKQRVSLTGHGITAEQPPATPGLSELSVETGIFILKLRTRIQETPHGVLPLITNTHVYISY